jgi:hypothetical protein
MIEGELSHREYECSIETDNGPFKVPWPVTEVVIDSVSVLDRKEKQGSEGQHSGHVFDARKDSLVQ